MSISGVGLALLLIGLVLWFAAHAPAAGHVLVIIGGIVLIVGLFVANRVP